MALNMKRTSQGAIAIDLMVSQVAERAAEEETEAYISVVQKARTFKMCYVMWTIRSFR